MNKLLLIDGSNLIFRAYYATKDRPMLSPKGQNVNAVHTVAGMIKKMIDLHKPTHIFIALDAGKETFRHKMYDEYKAGRTETPESLKEQFNIVKELYDAMGIVYGGDKEFEADDLIASYAKIAKDKGFEVQIVSGDKDLLQIVDDRVSVFTPKSNAFGKDINYTPKIFEEKYGFTPKDFILFKAIVGDTSDNIIGVTGIGEKGATDLIKEYKVYDKILEFAKENQKTKRNQNFVLQKKRVLTNLKLVTLIEDIELNENLRELKFEDYNYKMMIPFFKEQGMKKHYNSFKNSTEMVFITNTEYTIIENFTSEIIGKENFIYTQSLTNNYHLSKPLGFGLKNENGTYFLAMENINDAFLKFIQDDSIKITFDLKKLMGILKINKIGNFSFDVKIANNVLSTENDKKSFDFICLENGIKDIYNYEEIYGTKTNPTFDISKIRSDLTAKAKALKILYINIINELEKKKLEEVYYKIEHPLIIVLAKMENNGIYIDEKKLNSLKKEYEINMKDIEDKLKKITDINFKSPQQLNNFLFINLGVSTKGLKKTKNGFSTDVDALKFILTNTSKEEISNKFIKLLLEFRKISKIYSTYLVGLEKYIVSGKIHPIYQQLLTETGRLSATEPNVQNIPSRTKEGKVIRTLFIAPIGYKLVTFDYSQVELRIVAHLADEKNMIKDFNEGLDIHLQTAKKILKKTEVTSKERNEAKAINFGILYGMSAYGLASQTNTTIIEAKEFINKYFDAYPKIRKYQEQLIENVMKKGYSKTIFDRIRYIDNNTTNRKELESISRIAINTPIQGAAADIIKIAMSDIHNYIEKNCSDIIMVMQIHDELVFYIKEECCEKRIKDIESIMEKVVDFSVKLKVEHGVGNNWEGAK